MILPCRTIPLEWLSDFLYKEWRLVFFPVLEEHWKGFFPYKSHLNSEFQTSAHTIWKFLSYKISHYCIRQLYQESHLLQASKRIHWAISSWIQIQRGKILDQQIWEILKSSARKTNPSYILYGTNCHCVNQQDSSRSEEILSGSKDGLLYWKLRWRKLTAL